MLAYRHKRVGVSTLVMAAGAVLSLVAGVARRPWYLILVGALIWMIGDSIHDPGAIERLRVLKGAALVLSGVAAVTGLVCAALLGIGRLLAGIV
jgi:hypothetical protein